MWIDEAGIRAGQKWRNEIADGIKVGVAGGMRLRYHQLKLSLISDATQYSLISDPYPFLHAH